MNKQKFSDVEYMKGKIMKNQGGSITWLLLIVILIVLCGIFSVDKERIAIATDIKYGNLVTNKKSNMFLNIGDNVLRSLKPHRDGRDGLLFTTDYWVSMFYAKVCYERARLEMEMEAARR